ncbi:MAG: PorV/PorQ family protein [Candidatus Kryptoniota bacterium]
MKSLPLTLAFLILSNSAIYSQGGSAGFAILKIGFTARELSLGGSADVISTDPVAVLTNPASLTFSQEEAYSSHFTLTHQQYIAGSTIDFLGSRFRVNGIGFGTAVLISSIPGIEVRTEPGPPQAIFSAKDFLFSFGAGKSFRNLDFGISAAYLYEKIFVYESQGLAFNAGLRYHLIENVVIGISAGNIGSASKMAYQPIALPVFIRAGGSYRHKFSQEFSATGYIGFHTFKSGGIHAAVGGEVGYMQMIYLRAGYSSGKDLTGMSFGAGFSYKFVRLDYSYVPLKLDFGNSQTFSLSFAI